MAKRVGAVLGGDDESAGPGAGWRRKGRASRRGEPRMGPSGQEVSRVGMSDWPCEGSAGVVGMVRTAEFRVGKSGMASIWGGKSAGHEAYRPVGYG